MSRDFHDDRDYAQMEPWQRAALFLLRSIATATWLTAVAAWVAVLFVVFVLH
jgi:hypothetical protein